MGIIADIERYCAGPSGKIKRLLGYIASNVTVPSSKHTEIIITARFTKLAVANHYIVGRCNGSSSHCKSAAAGSLPIRCTRLYQYQHSGRHADTPQNVWVEIAGAARMPGFFLVEGVTEDSCTTQLHAAVSANRTWCRS